jgi:hypothetical protein
LNTAHEDGTAGWDEVASGLLVSVWSFLSMGISFRVFPAVYFVLSISFARFFFTRDFFFARDFPFHEYFLVKNISLHDHFLFLTRPVA